MRKRIVAGAVAGALALGGAGATVAFAGNGTSNSATPQVTPSPGATAGATANGPARQARRETQIQDQLKSLVANGTITQAQADKVASTLAAADVNGGPGGQGGFGGMRGPGAGGRFGDLLQPELQAAATTLGLTTDQLETQLRSGSTLAAIAKKQGKDTNALVSVLVTAAKTQIDAAVKAGKLNSTMATKLEGNLQQRITEVVNNGFKAGFGGHNWGRMPGGGPGGMNGTPAPSPSGSTSANPSSFSNA